MNATMVSTVLGALFAFGANAATYYLTNNGTADDTDTVAAIAGGLAGVFYGYSGIPREWLETIQRREWIEMLCKDAERVYQ